MLCTNQVWERPVTGSKFYRPKMGKKLTSLNRYISVITDIDEKYVVVFEHNINHLSFGYVGLSQLENYFSCFAFFLLTFFFFFSYFSVAVYFYSKPLNALYSKFERLKILGLLCDRNRGCQFGWIRLNRVLQNFELLNH